MLDNILVEHRLEGFIDDISFFMQPYTSATMQKHLSRAIESEICRYLAGPCDSLTKYVFPFELLPSTDETENFCQSINHAVHSFGSIELKYIKHALALTLGMKNYSHLQYLQKLRSKLGLKQKDVHQDTLRPNWMSSYIRPGQVYLTPIKGHAAVIQKLKENMFCGFHSDGLRTYIPYAVRKFRLYFPSPTSYIAAANIIALDISNCGPECWRLMTSVSESNNSKNKFKAEEACIKWQQQNTFD